MKAHIFWSMLLFGALWGAGKEPTLPFVDNVRVKFAPAGDTTWTVAGLTEFPAAITATDMTPDGRFMAIGDANGNVSLYDVNARQILWTQPVIAGGYAVHIIKVDTSASQILAAKTPGQNDPSHMYYLGADGTVTDMGVQEAFSPQCQGVTKMDPSQFLWSPDASTFFVHYETHARANIDGCQVAAEKYVFMNDMRTAATDIRLVALEAFKAPEEDEPDTVWCTAPARMAISTDGKTLATSHCNSRVVQWAISKGKLKHKKTSKGIQYMLRRDGYDPVSGNGHMAFNRRGEIFFGMGAPGQMAKSSIIRLSADLARAELLAYVHMPYPKPMLSADENYLMAGSDIVFAWDLRKKQILYYGPQGINNGMHAQLHPKKRVVILPVGRQLQFLAESKGLTMRLTTNWQKTGRYIKVGDSIYVAGKGTFNYGYGEWLREDRKYGDSWISEFKGDKAGDQGELVELSFRSENGGTFVLFGGRNKNDAGGDFMRTARNW